MAFNFELKMLIAPLGIWGSLKWRRDQDDARKCGSKQSLVNDRNCGEGESLGLPQGSLDAELPPLVPHPTEECAQL